LTGCGTVMNQSINNNETSSLIINNLDYEMITNESTESNAYEISFRINNRSNHPSTITFINVPVSCEYEFTDSNGYTLETKWIGNLCALNDVVISANASFEGGSVAYTKEAAETVSVVNTIYYYSNEMIQEKIISSNF